METQQFAWNVKPYFLVGCGGGGKKEKYFQNAFCWGGGGGGVGRGRKKNISKMHSAAIFTYHAKP